MLKGTTIRIYCLFLCFLFLIVNIRNSTSSLNEIDADDDRNNIPVSSNSSSCIVVDLVHVVVVYAGSAAIDALRRRRAVASAAPRRGHDPFIEDRSSRAVAGALICGSLLLNDRANGFC